MTNIIAKTSDFLIRVVMIFTTLVALLFFANYYPTNALVYGFLSVIFILSLIIKGLSDIFAKDK